MKKELHELRKMEAGWFGKNKHYVKKEVIVKNNHYLEEKEKITTELNSYKDRYMSLERERDDLLRRIADLEAELSRMHSDHGLHRTVCLKDKSVLEQQIDSLNKRLDQLMRENESLRRQSMIKP